MARSLATRIIRTCQPETIEEELEVLWRELAHQTPAARTIMSNLVVFQARASADAVDIQAPVEAVPIEGVVQRHPSRVILLIHGNDPDQLQAPVAAAAGILLFGAEETRLAVEQITIRSVTAEKSLPSIVRRFVLGDLPTSVWWCEDLSESPPLSALVTIGRQFIYDSRQWRRARVGLATIATLLDDPHTPDLADVNWRRLTPMRQAIQHGLQRMTPETTAQTPIRVHVRHHRSEAAAAWLIIGWLASTLDRGPHPRLEATLEEHDDNVRPLSVSIDIAGFGALSADMDASQVLVADSLAGVPFAVKVPSERITDAIAAELKSLGHDLSLNAAIRAAHERSSRAG